ncbi:MAG: hypothetical protein ABSC88_13035 [Terracidiphilus sp.]
MSRKNIFRIIAVLFIGAAMYHAAAFLVPAFSYGGAHWRHAAFCVIDLLCACYLLRRPRWFVAAFGVLTLETLCSHGAHAWMLWHTGRRLDWLSFAVLIVVPLTLVLLIRDALDLRSRPVA